MSSKKKDLISSISSAESAESALDLSEQTPLFGQLPFVSASLTPKPSLKSTGRKSLSTTMSEPYKQIDLEELTSSQGGILANHSALQENNSERKMTAISGRKWLALFDNATPLGLLQKMLLVTSQWASTKCYLTWKAKGTPQGRLLFQLVPLARRTDAIGSGLLHTPTATANQMAPSMKSGWRMFPTPRTRGLLGGTGSKEMMMAAVDAGFSTREEAERMMGLKMWPTPTTQDSNKAPKKWRESYQNNLTAAAFNPEKIGMIPTPAASNYKGAVKNRFMGSPTYRGNLDEWVRTSKEDKHLSANWVEALMGFPPGWTALGKTEYQEYLTAKKAAQKGSKG